MSEQSQSIAELAKALVKVQSELKAAKKDSENPFFRSHYADLNAVWEVCRGPLTKNGFAVVQAGDGDCLVTTLIHTSGEWIRGKMKLTPVKQNDPQAQGSALTYLRRYSLAAIVGIVADEDDDGEGAMGRNQALSPASAIRTPEQGQTAQKSNPGAPKGPLTLHRSRFELSDPITSKKGKVFRKAIDAEGASYFVWDDTVTADLQIAGDSEVTVEFEAGQFPTIRRVIANEAA